MTSSNCTLLCYNPFVPVTAKATSEEFHMRTAKTTTLMGLFLLKQEEEALILATLSGINGW